MASLSDSGVDLALSNVAVFALGMALIGLGLHRFAGYWRFVRAARAAVGRVVAIDLKDFDHTRNTRVFYTITVEFPTTRGARRRIRQVRHSNCGIVHAHGEHISVLYDPNQPERALLRSEVSWGPSLLALAAGISISLFSVAHSLLL